jgi:hypothetical protein
VLALLANRNANSATQQLLAAHGFSVPVIAGRSIMASARRGSFAADDLELAENRQ